MYKLLLEKNARKDLDSLDVKEIRRIWTHIYQLGEDPHPHGSIKLKGSVNDLRIRIGDYRVIYEINDSEKTITIFGVKHRKDAYRNLPLI